MAVLRLWPDPSPAPLDDGALVALYTPLDRASPWLRMNFVASLDGAGTVNGRSEGLSGPADKQIFGLLRMLCDALLVGAGTVREEGYRALRLDPARRDWRLAHGLAEYPTLVVVSGRGALDPAHPALAGAPVRPIVVTRATIDPGRLADVAEVVQVGAESVDLPAALAELHRRGLYQVLGEGGPHLFGSLTGAGLVDELCLTLSPLLCGPGADRITTGEAFGTQEKMTLRHALLAEGQVFFRYSR